MKINNEIFREIEKYAVAIAGTHINSNNELDIDYSSQGSGVCILIGGRYFIATAGHNIDKFNSGMKYIIIFPDVGNRGINITNANSIINSNIDIGWIEINCNAAKLMKRSFLPIERFAPYSNGLNSSICLFGFPSNYTVIQSSPPQFTCNGSIFDTTVMSNQQLIGITNQDRLHLNWNNNYNNNIHPYPKGLSGCGIWMINNQTNDIASWSHNSIQLIGTDCAFTSLNGYQCVIGVKIHKWLEILMKDNSELKHLIEPMLNCTYIL
jgi:hypothetical protein